MRLKELTLIGFKSFKDRTKLGFEDGITAVVGPNGCGKSNIVDAIFWVLGDQSPKHLRTQHMAEVIFAGTDQHKPSGFCEVALKLSKGDVTVPKEYDDTSLPDVTVTRRLYVDGESEYMINHQRCRLKDVMSLFLDTGLVGSSYGIIQQGVISQMIQSRPVDRSLLIQEVAGLTKYKVKKDEAQRKMMLTKTHCTRIQDLISELEKQHTSLEQQAEDAKRYKEVDTRVKELHDRVRSLEGFLLDTDITQKSSAKQAAEDKLAQILTTLNHSQATLEKTNQDLRLKDEALRKQRHDLDQFSQTVESARLEVNNLFHNQERLDLLIKQSQQESQRLKAQVQDSQRRKASDEAQAQRLADDLGQSVTGQFKTLEQQCDQLKMQWDAKVAETETQQQALNELQETLESLQVSYRHTEDKKRALEHEMEKRTVKADQIRAWIRAQGSPQEKFQVPEAFSPVVDALEVAPEHKESATRFLHFFQSLWTCRDRQSLKQLASTLPRDRTRGMMVALSVSGAGGAGALSSASGAGIPSSAQKIWDCLGAQSTSSVLSKPLYEVETLEQLLDILESQPVPLPCHFRSKDGAVLFDDGVIYFPPTRLDQSDLFHHKDQERSLLAEIEKLKREWSTLESQLKQYAEKLESLKTEEQELQATCESLETESVALKEDMIRAQAQRDAFAKTKDEREQMIARHREEAARLAEQIDDLGSQINLLELNQKQYQQEHVKTKQDLETSKKRCEGLEAEHYTKKQGVDETQKAYELLLDQRESLLGQTRKLEKEMAELEQQKFQLTSAVEAAQQRLEELRQEESIPSVPEDLRALSEEEQRSTLSKMSREYNSGKRELERLGDVNLLAIHQYEEINERLKFLIQQRDDLLESLKNLEVTIHEIQSNVQETFMNVFQRVNEAFQKHFPVLFRGGKGYLSLTEELTEDGLPGVEIHAAPPGKKMKHNALLSGGEKALVALGLIISLFEVKPSPFLVMDEVDGPFDEANVESFIDICRHIAKLTQVILITHNKKTMQSADTLYGVTLREKGVSQIVSVRLVPGHA